MSQELSEMHIDEFRPEDKEAVIAGMADIQEVERALFDTRRPGHEMAQEYFDEVFNEVQKKQGRIFIARISDKVAGFIIVWIERDADPIHTAESNVYAYISDVWVAPNLRDHGLFGKLNQKVEEYLKGFPEVHFLRLSVVATNERAKAAYAKQGFIQEEIKMGKRIAPSS